MYKLKILILNITITLGVAEYYNDLTLNAVINKADANLYKGKASTKNCVIA